MDKYQVTLSWQNNNAADFTYETYDRTHTVTFAGGEKISLSASANYFGNDALANPEELLLAAVASCYMLTFLAIAAKQKFVVNKYEDFPQATLEKNDQGRLFIGEVVLRPKITFEPSKQPDPATLQKIREKSHANCFISNSLLAKIRVEINVA